MPSIKWQHVWGSPIQNPAPLTHPPLSLRTAVARIWIGTSFGLNADIWYTEPASHDVQTIGTNGTMTYVLPINSLDETKDVDAVYIYAHGGGMAIGHPLQYLNEYRRWVGAAAKRGKKIVILAPVYPLSSQKKWPAQRDALAALYPWVLSQGINPSRIILGGDSADADLALLYLIYLRDQSLMTTQPAPVVLYSLNIDMTAAQARYTPRIKTDFMFEYLSIVPFNKRYAEARESAFRFLLEISAPLAKDVGSLPPQLVYWSTIEVLASTSERWIERSQKASGDVT